MRKVQAIMVIACLLVFSLIASAEDKQTPKATNRIELLPRDLEIQLALSALPPHLRDNATVYVLNPEKGFEVARKGTNGFHAFVARTGDDTFRGSWPLRNIEMIFSTRFPLIAPASTHRCGFSLTRQKYRPRGLLPEN